MKNNVLLLIAIGFTTLSFSCGMQLAISHKPVFDYEIDRLASDGFVHVGAENITKMQNMKTVLGMCRQKRNVCGMDAGISAGFLLQPKEVFYDLKNPPNLIFYGDGTGYDQLIKEYPIMRPKAYKDKDVGVLPTSLSIFWTKNFKNHKAVHEPFDDADSLLALAKKEIRDQRPVIIQVAIVGEEGLPVFMPDQHLGLRTFLNAHWVVLLGFSEQNKGEWLIRDNWGLSGTVKNQSHNLIRISDASLKKIADTRSLADDLKLYLDEPDLPIFLDDADDDDNQTELKKDFAAMKAFNLIRFEKK